MAVVDEQIRIVLDSVSLNLNDHPPGTSANFWTTSSRTPGTFVLNNWRRRAGQGPLHGRPLRLAAKVEAIAGARGEPDRYWRSLLLLVQSGTAVG